MRVRTAHEGERPPVMNVLDAAMLEVDAAEVGDRMAEDGVLVAVEEGRLLGACVFEVDGGAVSVDAIAVRPGRRGQGIGAALVEAAAERGEVLTAEFDDRVRPFYESLGFEVEPLDDGRLRGVR